LKTRLVISFVCLFAAAVGCKGRKSASAEHEHVRERTAAFLLKRMAENRFDFQWLGMKLDAEVTTPEGNQTFNTNVRMRKDSLIWVSINPALGIEVLRVLISPDSVKVVSKIPENKFWYAGDYKVLNDMLKMEADFGMLQDLLVGNPLDFDHKDERFRSKVEGNQHVLVTRYKRKVRKIVGTDDRKLTSEDSLVYNQETKQYERLARKTSDEDDIIIKRFWLNGLTDRLEKTVFNDILEARTLEISHHGTESIDNQVYPVETNLKVVTTKAKNAFSFRITRMKLDRTYDFPFEIPKDYERRQLP